MLALGCRATKGLSGIGKMRNLPFDDGSERMVQMPDDGLRFFTETYEPKEEDGPLEPVRRRGMACGPVG